MNKTIIATLVASSLSFTATAEKVDVIAANQATQKIITEQMEVIDAAILAKLNAQNERVTELNGVTYEQDEKGVWAAVGTSALGLTAALLSGSTGGSGSPDDNGIPDYDFETGAVPDGEGLSPTPEQGPITDFISSGELGGEIQREGNDYLITMVNGEQVKLHNVERTDDRNVSFSSAGQNYNLHKKHDGTFWIQQEQGNGTGSWKTIGTGQDVLNNIGERRGDAIYGGDAPVRGGNIDGKLGGSEVHPDIDYPEVPGVDNKPGTPDVDNKPIAPEVDNKPGTDDTTPEMDVDHGWGIADSDEWKPVTDEMPEVDAPENGFISITKDGQVWFNGEDTRYTAVPAVDGSMTIVSIDHGTDMGVAIPSGSEGNYTVKGLNGGEYHYNAKTGAISVIKAPDASIDRPVADIPQDVTPDWGVDGETPEWGVDAPVDLTVGTIVDTPNGKIIMGANGNVITTNGEEIRITDGQTVQQFTIDGNKIVNADGEVVARGHKRDNGNVVINGTNGQSYLLKNVDGRLVLDSTFDRGIEGSNPNRPIIDKDGAEKPEMESPRPEYALVDGDLFKNGEHVGSVTKAENVHQTMLRVLDTDGTQVAAITRGQSHGVEGRGDYLTVTKYNEDGTKTRVTDLSKQEDGSWAGHTRFAKDVSIKRMNPTRVAGSIDGVNFVANNVDGAITVKSQGKEYTGAEAAKRLADKRGMSQELRNKIKAKFQQRFAK